MIQAGVAMLAYSFRDFSQGEKPLYDRLNSVTYKLNSVEYIINVQCQIGQ